MAHGAALGRVQRRSGNGEDAARRRRQREGRHARRRDHAAFHGLHQRQRAPSSKRCSRPAPSANSVKTNGTTALMIAAASGSAGAVKALLDHGAEVNAKEAVHGQTALMFAAALNRVDVVKLLAQRGADVNIASKAPSSSAFASIRMATSSKRPQPEAVADAVAVEAAAVAALRLPLPQRPKPKPKPTPAMKPPTRQPRQTPPKLRTMPPFPISIFSPAHSGSKAPRRVSPRPRQRRRCRRARSPPRRRRSDGRHDRSALRGARRAHRNRARAGRSRRGSQPGERR